MGFKKGHKVRGKQNKVVKLCKRCDSGVLAATNKTGLCASCNSSVYKDRQFNDFLKASTVLIPL